MSKEKATDQRAYVRSDPNRYRIVPIGSGRVGWAIERDGMVWHTGPRLEALKGLNGGEIHLPGRPEDRPDRERLAQRFERFKAAV